MLKEELLEIINKAWADNDQNLQYAKEAVEKTLAMLDSGEIRVADKIDQIWVVNEWIKRAILLSFKLNLSKPIENYPFNYYDKVDLKLQTGRKKIIKEMQLE